MPATEEETVKMLYSEDVDKWMQIDPMFIDRITLYLTTLHSKLKNAKTDATVAPDEFQYLVYEIEKWSDTLRVAIAKNHTVLTKEDAFAMADMNAQKQK